MSRPGSSSRARSSLGTMETLSPASPGQSWCRRTGRYSTTTGRTHDRPTVMQMSGTPWETPSLSPERRTLPLFSLFHASPTSPPPDARLPPRCRRSSACVAGRPPGYPGTPLRCVVPSSLMGLRSLPVLPAPCDSERGRADGVSTRRKSAVAPHPTVCPQYLLIGAIEVSQVQSVRHLAEHEDTCGIPIYQRAVLDNLPMSAGCEVSKPGTPSYPCPRADQSFTCGGVMNGLC